MRIESVLVAALLVSSCSSEAARLRDAKEIGAIDIDPRASLGAIRALTPASPAIEYPRGEHGIENLVQAQWGKSLFAPAIVELSFYAPAAITDASVPIHVTVTPPFEGTILGVRIGDTADAALPKLRRHYPGARISETTPYLTRPGDTSQEWVIRVDDDHLLTYSKRHRIRRGKPVEPPEYNVSLRHSTLGFTIRQKPQ